MDLFVQNLDKIRRVVEFIVRDYHFKYETDELVNVAYIGYVRAVTNNPSSVYTKFNNIHTLLKRVKYDIKDYIREQRKIRVIEKMERVGIVVPLFCNSSFQSYNDDDKIAHIAPPDNREESFGDSDNRDTLDYLMNNSGLTETERRFIYIRFIEENTMEETSNIMGWSYSSTNNTRKNAMKKIRDKIERECLFC